MWDQPASGRVSTVLGPETCLLICGMGWDECQSRSGHRALQPHLPDAGARSGLCLIAATQTLTLSGLVTGTLSQPTAPQGRRPPGDPNHQVRTLDLFLRENAVWLSGTEPGTARSQAPLPVDLSGIASLLGTAVYLTPSTACMYLLLCPPVSPVCRVCAVKSDCRACRRSELEGWEGGGVERV